MATAPLLRILFVDDEQRILDGLQALLRRYRKKWEMHFVCGGQAGLDVLATAPFDVAVSDIRMPHMDGAEFLTRVQAQYPDVVRIVLSGQTEPHVSKRLVNIAHQFLAKPCDAEKLCEVIEGTMAIRGLLQHPELRVLVNSLGHLPSAPLIYQRVVRLLQSDRGDLTELADLLQEDVALAAKVLQVANSAFFGLPQKISGVTQAVSYLGTETVKALVLSVEVGATLGEIRPVRGLDLDRVRQRDLMAATVARRFLKDKDEGDAAFTAALLQNTGLVILASRRSEQLQQMVDEAIELRCPLVDVERRTLGLSHTELGAFLLGLWGLPAPVVNAVLHHQSPSRSLESRFDPCGAVHVAAALCGQSSQGGPEDVLVPTMDTRYLAALRKGGMKVDIQAWRHLASSVVDQEECR